MVDVTNKPQIVEHIHKSLTQTVYETKWIPTSARFVLLGSPPRQSGMIQLYNLVKGDAELVAELERPKSFKCGTFGHSALAERHPKARTSPSALVEKALKECRKVAYALPSVASDDRTLALVLVSLFLNAAGTCGIIALGCWGAGQS